MTADSAEASAMRYVLTGYIAGDLLRHAMEEGLVPPAQLLEATPDGLIRLRLASGLLVNIRVDVSPDAWNDPLMRHASS